MKKGAKLQVAMGIMVFVTVFTTLTLAQDKPRQEATEADDLRLQIVILKSQLAQALSTAAKCEAEGPQSAKMAAEAQSGAQTLIKSLDARGLMIDQNTNKIVAKPIDPKSEEKPAEAKPKGGR